MIDFQGSTYNDFIEFLDIRALNGLFKAPFCYSCGLETSNINAHGLRECKKCSISYSSAPTDNNNEVDDHHATEWMKAGK